MINIENNRKDDLYFLQGKVRILVLNTTFNNISVISWQSVLLVEDIGVPGENHRPILLLLNVTVCVKVKSTYIFYFIV